MVAALLILPAGASAATTLYVAPGGVSATPCTQAAPCDLGFALAEGASSGDEVIVEPGDYEVTDPGGVAVVAGVDVHGAAGQPRPVIHGSLSVPIIGANGPGTSLAHLVIRQDGDGASALHSAAATTLTDLVLQMTGAEGSAAELSSGAILSDSTALDSNDTGTAIKSVAPGLAALHNVTAWATGTHGEGIEVTSAAPISATNTIARAPNADPAFGADIYNPSLGIALPTLTNSSYATTAAGPGGTVTILGAGNQSAAPLLVDPANGDFHEQLGSPTINAGIPDPLSGTTDPDGDARTLGLRPDIGADEYVPRAPSVSTGDPIGVTSSAGTLTGTVDPRGLATSYRFEYGATPLYGASTPTQDAGSGSGAVPVSAPLGNLQPGSVVHYRLIASNTDGETAGGDRTLIALPVALSPTQPSITQIQLPQNVSVGQPVNFQISGTDSDDTVNSVVIDFGDGPGFFAESACRLRPSDPVFSTSRSSSFTVPYTFSRAGAHTVTITVGSGDCGKNGQTTTQTVEVNVGSAKTHAARVRAREAALITMAKGCKGAGLLPTKKNHTRVENATICLLNKQRRANHRKPFRKNKKLRKAAALHNGYMARGGFFAHQGPGEPALGARFHKVRYPGGGGENLGAGSGVPYATPRSMVMAWMNSPVHRANILERAFHTIGLAVMARKPEAPQTPGATYTTEFGTTRK